MRDIDKAKAALTGKVTCALAKGDVLLTSEEHGVRPMLTFLQSQTDLTGFSAADKVIGKAAASLFVMANVTEVYGEVMSLPALETLRCYGVSSSCGMLTANIVNKTFDDICPMERAVENARSPQEAYEILQEKINGRK